MGERPTVLVVDDNEVILEIIVQQLALHDIYVVTTTRSTIGDALAQGIDNLIAFVLDVDMPDVDGRTLSTALRKNPKHDRVPIIFFTGMERARVEKMAQRIGNTSVVSKSEGINGLWTEILRVTDIVVDAEEVVDGEPAQAISDFVDLEDDTDHSRRTVQPPDGRQSHARISYPNRDSLSSIHNQVTTRPPKIGNDDGRR